MEFPLFSKLYHLPLVLSLDTPEKSLVLFFYFLPSYHIFIHIDKIPSNPSLSQAQQSLLSQTFLVRGAVSPSSSWPFAGLILLYPCPSYVGSQN